MSLLCIQCHSPSGGVEERFRREVLKEPSFEAVEGAVSGGIEGGLADSLEGVVETLEIYGVRGVLQTANKVCVMEGPCSVAHAPRLEFSPLHRFDTFLQNHLLLIPCRLLQLCIDAINRMS
jgi:hypothetical protein